MHPNLTALLLHPNIPTTTVNPINLNYRRALFLILLSTLVLYFIFSPAVTILYYTGDDLRYLFGSPNAVCRHDDGFNFMLTIGRPLQAYLDCLSFRFAYTVEHMRIIRIICLVLIATCVGLFAEWLCYLGFSVVIAFLASLSVFLIQHFYVDTLAYGAVSLPFAVLLAIISYACLNQVFRQTRSWMKVGWLSSASITLLFSMLSYPAMSFFFVTLILSTTLFTSLQYWPSTRRRIIMESVFFCLIGAIYFAWAAYFMRHHARTPIPEAYRVSHPNFNIIEMIQRMGLMANVFDEKWAISIRSNMLIQGWVVVLLTIVGIISATINFTQNTLYQLNKILARRFLLEAIICVILLLMLATAFFLVMPSRSLIETRVLFAAITAGFVFLFWCLNQACTLLFKHSVNTALTVALVSVVAIQAHQANVVLLNESLSHQYYIKDTKDRIQSGLSQFNPLKRVHFIIPSNNYPYDRFFMANAALMQLLGKDNYKIQWCSQTRDALGTEKNRQAKTLACVKSLPKNTIAITYSFEHDNYAKSSNMAIVKNHYVNLNPDESRARKQASLN